MAEARKAKKAEEEKFDAFINSLKERGMNMDGFPYAFGITDSMVQLDKIPGYDKAFIDMGVKSFIPENKHPPDSIMTSWRLYMYKQTM